MPVEQAKPAAAVTAPATGLPPSGPWNTGQSPDKRWLGKSNPNYLLNLFTALLAASALIIMLVVGVAIYWIYSSAMVKNAETSAISVVKAIMSAEVDNLLQDAPDGRLMLAVRPDDLARLDLQMNRYLKFFSMHQIKLFTPDRRIIYSTDASLIGKIDKDDTDLDRVLASGEAFAELAQKKEYAAMVEAYAPIFDADHRVLGVFQIYADITATWDAIFKVLLLTMAALGAVLSVCLFSLYLPMQRGTLSLLVAHRELNELAARDFLTGAYNRRYITERVKKEFHRMRRQNDMEPIKDSIAFIMADIDYFKKVNDTYGHCAGDEVLCAVSQRLKDGLRDFDVLCRYGGEEFLIMLPDTGEHDAMAVAQRLQESFISAPVMVEGIGPVPVTLSFGVATTHDGQEPEQVVIERADHALYLAKERGRNRVVLAAHPVPAEVPEL